MALKIIGLILMVIGAVVIFGANVIIRKTGYDKKVACKYADTMDEEALKKFKEQKAAAIVKLFGLIALIPGTIIIYFTFK